MLESKWETLAEYWIMLYIPNDEVCSSNNINYNIMSYHYLFKFIIIGDTAVGKSCILYQFLEGKFRVKHEMTVGVEFGAKILDLQNKKIKL